ncbi:uncharacterized protein BJX67DRAFT_367599 [Aspergillus lucknowensis]|uniref:Uncharacterized protein n=1 Tax=Aspergillus lucknowensis TaxID=176173 RepID=A0ABR4L8T2_9EURO
MQVNNTALTVSGCYATMQCNFQPRNLFSQLIVVYPTSQGERIQSHVLFSSSPVCLLLIIVLHTSFLKPCSFTGYPLVLKCRECLEWRSLAVATPRLRSLTIMGTIGSRQRHDYVDGPGSQRKHPRGALEGGHLKSEDEDGRVKSKNQMACEVETNRGSQSPVDEQKPSSHSLSNNVLEL